MASYLKEYQQKRQFQHTPEPRGLSRKKETKSSSKKKLRFVIQQHDARRFHYDFRLELEGVLKSWAVPKGPSLNPNDKRLAVHVEDHPLEYDKFEGIIPERQYGAGTVLLWDEGEWIPQGNPVADYRRGRLKFYLSGHKLQGAWSLVRMNTRESSRQENWLLIKEQDEQARADHEINITPQEKRSVMSGRTLEEIASNVTLSKKKISNDKKRSYSQSEPTRATLIDDLARLPNVIKLRHETPSPWKGEGWDGGNVDRDNPHPNPPPERGRGHSFLNLMTLARLPGARRAAFPKMMRPQLARLVDHSPQGEDWLFEIKYDGYRVLSSMHNQRAHLYTRQGYDWTEKFTQHEKVLLTLPVKEAWLDGEMVVMGHDGVTDFQMLQNAFEEKSEHQITYMIFDILYCDGYSLLSVPLIERKKLLKKLLCGLSATQNLISYSDHIQGGGSTLFEHACQHGLEGFIAKRSNSLYSGTRSFDWLKIKCRKRQEFVIGGFTEPSGSREGLGALLLGVYGQDKKLHYAGKVGTGFNDKMLRSLSSRLNSLKQKQSPFISIPSDVVQEAHWVKPRLVAEVNFSQWTKENLLRQAAFVSLREDKDAQNIVREQPSPLPTPSRSSKKQVSLNVANGASHKIAGITLTHPDRVLYPSDGVTKLELARYYESIAEWMLPHVRGRPLTLVRCPQGHASQCFFQKHANEIMPALKKIDIAEKSSKNEKDNTTAPYMIADTTAALISLVQMGVLEIHTWGARTPRLENPDRITFDLDPDELLPWKRVIEATQLLRELLTHLKLVSFLKTTGGKGLHIVVPLQPKHSWEEVKEFSHAVATYLANTLPDLFIAKATKVARKGKIYIDYLRNGRGATAIAAFSTRAKPGVPISVPLAWDELSEKIHSHSFNIHTISQRLKNLRSDPWKDYEKIKQLIPRNATSLL